LLYLLDANVLIDADRDYYPLNRVPEFWAWIVDRATKDQTKIPLARLIRRRSREK